MSNEIPKNANLAESIESLASDDKLQELKLQNKLQDLCLDAYLLVNFF